MTDVPRIYVTIPALLLCSVHLFSRAKQGQDDFIDNLLVYRDYPSVVEVRAAERPEVVRKLEALRQITTGKRLQKVSFILAALGSDYRYNRDYLFGILRTCGTPQSECDEDTAGFLIGLYHIGHREVLYTIMSAGLHSDGALSALLGDFYGEMLAKAPSQFMASLRRLSVSGQERACNLAGGGDGGGMDPNDFQQVQRTLRRTGDNVAIRCLRHVERSSQEAVENNKYAR